MAKITTQEALSLTPSQIKNMSTREITQAAQKLFDAANKRYKRLTEDERTANTPMAQTWKERAARNSAKGLKETPFSMRSYKTRGVSESKAREQARKALSEGQNALSPDKETNTVRKAKAHMSKMESMGVPEHLQTDPSFWRFVREGLKSDKAKKEGSEKFVRWCVKHYYPESDEISLEDALREEARKAERKYQEELYGPDTEAKAKRSKSKSKKRDASDEWTEPLRDSDRQP